MKDLSYLQVFSSKVLRSVRRILEKGFTIEDIDRYLEKSLLLVKPKVSRMRFERPCCGDKINEQVEVFREKQKRLKVSSV